MTKDQIQTNIELLLRDINRELSDECRRLLAHKALDFSDENPESFVSAKCVLLVAMENVSHLLSPHLTKEDWKNVKNLRYF